MEPDFTKVGGLTLPNRLREMIEAGRWPRTHEQELHQNIRSLVSKGRIQSFAPDQDRIYFVRPPFSTVATRIGHGDTFWSKFGAVEQIAPELAVLIGDFGLGSDSPILLDYREDISRPAVIRLKLNPLLGEMMPNGRKELLGWANVWLCCADTFAEMLGLGSGFFILTPWRDFERNGDVTAVDHLRALCPQGASRA
jgi:hypothetical protein